MEPSLRRQPASRRRLVLLFLAGFAVFMLGAAIGMHRLMHRVMRETAHVENAFPAAAQTSSAQSDVDEKSDKPSRHPRLSDVETDDVTETEFARLRSKMVKDQIVKRGVDDQRVLDAMRRVPRHRFVPAHLRDIAYSDSPLPIGHEQTISQPFIVALMTQEAQPSANSRALDIGTGSGYQAAILAELVDKVYSIEIVEPLAKESRARLQSLGYDNIEVRCGDGYSGWPEHAPFDIIIVAAAPDHVPQPLIDQLALGGHMVIPVGPRFMQSLLVIERQADGTIRRRNVTPVAFVPMTGEAQQD